jgi:hypothetical protein
MVELPVLNWREEGRQGSAGIEKPIKQAGIGSDRKAVDTALPSEKTGKTGQIVFCHRCSGRKLSKIGKRFGTGLSGGTQASRRIDLSAKKEKKLGKLKKRIEWPVFVKCVGLTL